jgi:hypothetical protein
LSDISFQVFTAVVDVSFGFLRRMLVDYIHPEDGGSTVHRNAEMFNHHMVQNTKENLQMLIR